MEALDVILSCDFSFGLLMFDYAAGRRPLQEASSQHATQACSNLPARALASSGPRRAAVGLWLQQARYGHPSVPPQSRARPWVLHTNTWLIPQPPLLVPRGPGERALRCSVLWEAFVLHEDQGQVTRSGD